MIEAGCTYTFDGDEVEVIAVNEDLGLVTFIYVDDPGQIEYQEKIADFEDLLS